MLDYNKILELIEKISESELTEFSLQTEEKEQKISLTLKKELPKYDPTSLIPLQTNLQSQNLPKAPEKTESPENKSSSSNLIEIRSPMVGTFYRAPSPNEAAFVEVNDQVKLGETLCILEAMKLMNELPAEISGTVKEICVENGDLVEYGDLLFKIEPN